MNTGERGKREEIDLQKRALRNALDTHGVITFERKDALAKWRTAVQELEQEGFVETELKEIDEQSTVFEVRRRRLAS